MITKILEYDWRGCHLCQKARDFLPDLVIDAHTHGTKLPAASAMINRNARTPGESFNYFPLGLYSDIFGMMFPETEYRQVVFSFPHLLGRERLDSLGIKKEASSDGRLIPIALCPPASLPDKLYLEGFYGVKSYRPLDMEKKDVRITDIFSERMLKAIDSRRGNLILHLPSCLQDNLDELIMLAARYPHARFILAHMGVNYLYSASYRDALVAIASFPNIFMDTAMVSDVEVFAAALGILGYQRILFGSDAPFSIINGHFCHDGQGKIRLKSSEDMAWVKIGYEGQEGIWPERFFHLQIIAAIKQAVDDLKKEDRQRAKLSIFSENALMVFGNKIAI